MQSRIYIIIGASRGLGASLVSECLNRGLKVIGIGRTREEKIGEIEKWRNTNIFNYIQADIGESSSVDIMKSAIDMCNGSPVCIIFNAAVIEPDVGHDGSLKFDVFKSINKTGVDGLNHVLQVFEKHLTAHGGMLAGISSISAWIPPIGGNKIAYPASKAYLDMALRSLRQLWDRRIHIMTVHLGHIGGSGSRLVPKYDAVAQSIVKATLRQRPPESICMSFAYCSSYRILRMLPDRVISKIINIIKSLLELISKEKQL